jgi:prolipoprotein diacylglyceryl transferase
VLAYIPAPPGSQWAIGPLHLRAYGFLIALGVFAAVWLADRRWQAQGGQPGEVSAIALWAVPAGLVGARLYHVVTDYELYTHHPLNALKIWNGGLGIWGGIAAGTLAGWAVVRHRHLDMAAMLDACAPALALAQAIGRWGNYFNQELFGRPSTLPWALQVDPSHRPAAYARYATFQPTFLYECLWDLAVVALLLWVGPRLRLRKGYLFVLYVALYTFGRFWTEWLRVDFAHRFLGLRLNDWVSIAVFCVATILLLTRGRAGPEEDAARDSGAGRAPPVDEVAVPVAGGRDLPGSGAVVAERGDEVGSGPGQP